MLKKCLFLFILYRFKWLYEGLMDPEYVAKAVVQGIQRNQEHIYLPPFVMKWGTVYLK